MLKRYDEYILFVLGVDSSKISKYIRDTLSEISDLDELYRLCSHIASVFEQYDQDYTNTMSKIESFYNFLCEYEQDIMDFLDGKSHKIILRSEEDE